MLAECMSCHRNDFRQIDSLKCHTDFREVKEKPLSLFSHRGNFLKKHAVVAKGDMVVCGHCHEQSYCAECHSRMSPETPAVLRSDEPDRWLIHRGDFITRHPIEAKSDPTACLKCHRQDRCVTCHQQRGVAATGDAGGLGPHTDGWMRKGAHDFHGTAARRDVSSCAVCHDRGPDTNCVACHKVGGAGGSPHPPGWSSRIEESRGQACVWCHR